MYPHTDQDASTATSKGPPDSALRSRIPGLRILEFGMLGFSMLGFRMMSTISARLGLSAYPTARYLEAPGTY